MSNKRLRIINQRNSVNKSFYKGKIRRLKAYWTLGETTFVCHHGLEVVEEISRMLTKEINNELKKDILDELLSKKNGFDAEEELAAAMTAEIKIETRTVK